MNPLSKYLEGANSYNASAKQLQDYRRKQKDEEKRKKELRAAENRNVLKEQLEDIWNPANIPQPSKPPTPEYIPPKEDKRRFSPEEEKNIIETHKKLKKLKNKLRSKLKAKVAEYE